MAFRACDRLIGRFNIVVLLSASMPSWSGYSLNFNNPMSYVDPLGLAPQATAEQMETFNLAKSSKDADLFYSASPDNEYEVKTNSDGTQCKYLNLLM